MGHAGSMSIWMGELSFMKTSQDRIAASAKSQELVVFSIRRDSVLRHSQEMTQVCSRKVTHGGTTESIRFGARQTPGGRFEQHAIVVVLGK
jgi:hypothetical protein